MKTPPSSFSILLLTLGVLLSGEAPAGEPKFTEDFESTENGQLPEGWNAQFGKWEVEDGVLSAAQVPADNHGAAARRVLPMQDGIFKMKFRLLEGATAFHFGFDPAKGELDKKGHLFSVIVTPRKWSVLKHVDKNKREEDPNETLAEADYEFEAGEWYELEVTKKGDDVTATIEGVGELEATHPTFHVKTPALVFRSIGKGPIEVDDIKVEKLDR